MKRRLMGMVRKTDELGRITIPKEICKTMGIEEGTPLDITLDGDCIVLQIYAPVCGICGRKRPTTVVAACEECRDEGHKRAVAAARAVIR
jgi:AbrB family looped-hinge helix DNA binding protein